MKICEILAVFFDRITDYFDDILTGIELWSLSRHLSDHRCAEGQNNMILRKKVSPETQEVTLAQHGL
jgi:hypothetical protein